MKKILGNLWPIKEHNERLLLPAAMDIFSTTQHVKITNAMNCLCVCVYMGGMGGGATERRV